MNNEDFCSYEIAVKLKELGFDQPCRHYYTKENASDNDVWLTTAAFSPEDWNNGRNAEPDFLKPLCSAPSLWQAQKWLRETHQWHIIIIPQMWKGLVFDYSLWHTMRGHESKNRGFNFSTYESALSAGIEAALKLIEIDKTKKS